MKLEDLFSVPPFSLPQADKQELLVSELNFLTDLHRKQCQDYNRLINLFHPGYASARELFEVPYVPVGLFKLERLMSVPESEVFKTLTSSGTSGQAVSKIFLDRITAQRQALALSSIMGSILGKERRPMIIIDTEEVLAGRDNLSARAAAILGMMNFGRDHFWALDNQMNLDKEGMKRFVDKHAGRPLLLYGFTFMVWRYFVRLIAEKEFHLPLSTLIHSGGWKKLSEEQVDNNFFKMRLKELTGVENVHNFYGMVEQIGSVFLEGEDGYLYPPAFADIIVRNPATWQEAPSGEAGVLQVVSALPLSYPGHSILTEDIGVVHGIDDSKCGWKGKRFSVLGRVPSVELRGCGDIHAYGRSRSQ